MATVCISRLTATVSVDINRYSGFFLPRDAYAKHEHSAVYAIETAGWIELVLVNVNSRSRSLYTVARPSVVCLSVVCLSVTLMRRTQPVEILDNIST